MNYLFPSISFLCNKAWKLVLIQASYIKKKRESKHDVSIVKPRVGIVTGRQVKNEFSTLSIQEQLILKNCKKSAYLSNKYQKSSVLISMDDSNVGRVKPRVDSHKEIPVIDESFALYKKEQLILKNRERSEYLRKKYPKPSVLISMDESNVSSEKPYIGTFKEVSVRDEAVVLSKKEQSDKVGFTLNEELLALHESETLVAQRMLNSIFVDEVAPQQVEPISTTPKQVESVLDTSHNSLYQELIVKEQWTRKEVMELCQELGLMIDGAIETINDWSFDVVDAPVLDEDIDIYVDLEIIEELKG